MSVRQRGGEGSALPPSILPKPPAKGAIPIGQYFYPCNLDRREVLHPHRFGDGFKFMEFGASGQGTMLALAITLGISAGGGGGDYRGERETENELVYGRWAGNRIAILGDYHSEADLERLGIETSPWAGEKHWGENPDAPLHALGNGWIDISKLVQNAVPRESWIDPSFWSATHV